MYIVFDTETTGLPKRYNAPLTDFNNWPRMVQIAWKVYDKDGSCTDTQNLIIRPDGWTVPPEAAKIHRITTERAQEEGIDLEVALNAFAEAISQSKYLIAHNISFDEKIVGCEYMRMGMANAVQKIKHVDTKTTTVDFCKIPKKRGGGYKWPTLTELHLKLFNQDFQDAHDALVDVEALARCFFKLQEIGWFKYSGDYKTIDVEASLQEMLEKADKAESEGGERPFSPLCLHTFHSILEGAGSVDDYIKVAKKLGHESMAITDNATMSGTFEFYQKCKEAGIKPIFGIDLYLNENIGDIDDGRAQGESFKQKIYVKDEEGYKNLNLLLYKANTEGFYQKGRVKSDWLFKHKEGLIVTTSSHESLYSYLVSRGEERKAEQIFQKFKKEFGEDFYIEFQLNESSQQREYNTFMVKMMKFYSVKPIMTNDILYPTEQDADLQDVVMAIKQKTSIDNAFLKENRRLYYFSRNDFHRVNKELDFNYPKEFIDLSLDNTLEIASKCNYEFEVGVEKYPRYEPTQDILDYFKVNTTKEIITKLAIAKLKQKLTYYHESKIVEMNKDIAKKYFDRLRYELDVIDSKGMLDYFMVNWEIIREYRKKGYDIGPARGSAAGSLLSWCLDIIKIDPIRFDLYFERFLNPSRNSPPDIDIDFMADTDHVTNEILYEKYGRNRVLNVGTFSTFNEKGCIKDVVRAHRGADATGYESDVFQVTKEMGGTLSEYDSLAEWFSEYPEHPGCSSRVKAWLKDPDNAIILEHTLKLQGQIRGIGQHAAGLVITPGPCFNYIPTNIIPKPKGEENSIVTAFQEADKSGKDLSALGILKLDRLKIETLNVIKDAIELIRKKHGEAVAKEVQEKVDHVDLEDQNLYQELRLGLNHGIFQFESAGMNSLIKGIRVDKFLELVAANALFRPGPMGIKADKEYIHNKFNPQDIKYIHPKLESILSESNGVLIFQEQVMFIAHKFAGMSLGEGDLLRRAMDKASKFIQKDLDSRTKGDNGEFLGPPLTEEEKENKKYKDFLNYWNMFIEGSLKNGIEQRDLEKIKEWMIKYLGYSFNKSHSLSYAYLAMQTLHLKHYYPLEFYTSLLNHPKTNGTKEEQAEWLNAAISSAIAKGIDILPPSRKSGWEWEITGHKEISMGFSAINGMGRIAFDELNEALKLQKETDLRSVSKYHFFDTNLSKFNKTSFTACVNAGVFDDWSPSREELFDLFAKKKKRKKVAANQLSIFSAESYEAELKPNEEQYIATTEKDKEKDFMEVCGINLAYIKKATDLKKRITEFAGREINSVNDYVDEDDYYFILVNKRMDSTKTGKNMLVIKVTDGVKDNTLRLFGRDAETWNKEFKQGMVYLAAMAKNDAGFLNFGKKEINGKKQLFIQEIGEL